VRDQIKSFIINFINEELIWKEFLNNFFIHSYNFPLF
jgi:hypothetical protein